MINFYQITLLLLFTTIIILSFYKKIDWFTFFIVLKTLHLLICIHLLHEVVIHNSTSILVAILYILCTSVLKSVLSVLLIIINQNKSNSLFI